MAHTIRDRDALVARVRKIRGQVEAIERALLAEAGCDKVMHLIASTRAAMGGLTQRVLEDHVRGHVVEGTKAERIAGGDALLAVLRSYAK